MMNEAILSEFLTHKNIQNNVSDYDVKGAKENKWSCKVAAVCLPEVHSLCAVRLDNLWNKVYKNAKCQER